MREQESTAVVSDTELIARLRAGESSAMAELYDRHRADAMLVGRMVCPRGDFEDLAAEAFARVFTSIVEGGGPTTHFRAYLRAVIRNLAVERSRRTGREQPASDQPWLLDSVDHQPDEVGDIDADHAARALRSLPQNWQQVLWRLDVQGSKPAEVAAELSISAATVSDTAYRAREGLRLAYLDQHLPPTADRDCDWARARLSRLARGSLSSRAGRKTRDHLDGCLECATVYAELHQLNTRLGAAIWPIFLAGAVTVEGFAATMSGGGGLATPSDPPGRTSSRTSSATAGSSLTSLSALGALAAVVAIVAGAWALLRDDGAPAALPPPTTSDSAPAQVAPPPADEQNAEPAGDPMPAADQAPIDGRRVETTDPSGGGQGPGPSPEPEPEPEPVDLAVGSPTVEPADEPYQWLFTAPILATEGAASEAFTITVQLTTSDLTGFIQRLSPGWDCGPIEAGGGNGDPYFFGHDVPATCSYAYEPGQAVPPLRLILESITMPTGTVAVGSDTNADPDTANDQRTF